MPRETLAPEALALIYLRSVRGWSKKELAARLGLADVRQLYRYERGEKPLRRETLNLLAARLGYSPEAVEALLFAHALIAPKGSGDGSPVALTLRERGTIDHAAITAGWTVADAVREELLRRRKEDKAAAARREAEALWERMKTATRQERRDLVEIFPEYRNWALAERLSHESERAAAHRPEEALELAKLALSIAERVPGKESWRSRVMGYGSAYVANALRVANDLAGADKAFAKAWDFWQCGTETELLAEWRLFDLEASLRRAQRDFGRALELLDRAKAASKGNPLAVGRILLKKEFVLEQMGDIGGAIVALKEAMPLVEGSGDLRLLFALHFNLTGDLCHLERYAEASELLPRVRDLAVRLGNELDLVRVLWLEARAAAGQGQKEEAVAGLEQVRREFTTRQLPYDAALVSLDLAALWLEEGQTSQVRELALAMAWVFRTKGIEREALAALRLFLDAVQQENATAGLARRLSAEIEKVSAAHGDGHG